LNNEVLNKKNQDGTYLITDEFITSVLPVIYDTVVTAKLSEQGDEGLATRSFSEEYLRLSDNMCEWNTEYGSALSVRFDAVIDRKEGTDSLGTPCRYLVINGVVLDGTGSVPALLRYMRD